MSSQLLTLLASTNYSPEPQLYDWYVDSAGGDDSSDGTRPSRAFATIDRLMTVLSSGESVGLARGSYWREEMRGTSLEGITVGTYGEGRLPTLDCADVVEGWAPVDGFDNVSSVIFQGAESGHLVSVWVDGERLDWASSIANCDANPGTYHTTDGGGGSYTVYVHPSSEGVIEVSRRHHGIITGADWSVSDVRTRRNLNNNGSFILGLNSVAYRVIAEDGHKHNFFSLPGSQAFDCVAYRCARPAAGREGTTLYVAFTSDGTGQFATYDRCVAVANASHVSVAQAAGVPLEGFYAHTSGPSVPWSYLNWNECGAINCVTGFGATDAVAVYTERNHVRNCAVGMLFSSDVDVYSSTDDYIDVTHSFSGARGITVSAQEFDIEGLRAHVSRASMDGIVYSTSPVGRVRKSTVRVTSNSGYIYVFRMASGSSEFSFENNLIVATQNGGEVGALAYHNPTTVANNVYAGASIDFELNGSGYFTVNSYFTAVQPGLEQGSFLSTVSLTNPAAGDFTIASSSPEVPSTVGVEDHGVTYVSLPTYEYLDSL